MTIDVQQIVREVIAELERRQRAGATTAATSPAAPSPACPTTPADAPPSHDARELVVCSRVVSLAEIGDRLGHVRRLVVPREAVITPAVRDALADRNIALVFGPTGGPATAAARLVLVVARTTYDPGALTAALRDDGMNVENHSSDCLIRTVDLLASRVRDGAALATVLTPDVAAALCLANRLPGVRAVSATDPGAMVDAARAVGANVLVVDPRGKGLYQLKQGVTTFCRSGPWPCPKVLQPRLG